jgi:hypothetical protein
MKTPISPHGFYILDRHEPKLVTFKEFAAWMQEDEASNGHKRQVSKTIIIGGGEVSTVFLTTPHCGPEGFGYFFETMIFGGPADMNGSQWRYKTWDEAVQGHEQVCAFVLHRLKHGKARRIHCCFIDDP